jgi:nicotinamide-nucleotide amidase
MNTDLQVLARQVGEALRQRGARLVTAESCTGGWVAKEITGIPGSSSWFDMGFVTYSNQAKQALLGVRAQTLQGQGAVSEATVAEMAAGALARSGADVALAISGIAGPGGGTADKPVGLVCFGWVTRTGRRVTASECFPGDREAVRAQAVARALRGVLDVLAA